MSLGSRHTPASRDVTLTTLWHHRRLGCWARGTDCDCNCDCDVAADPTVDVVVEDITRAMAAGWHDIGRGASCRARAPAALATCTSAELCGARLTSVLTHDATAIDLVPVTGCEGGAACAALAAEGGAAKIAAAGACTAGGCGAGDAAGGATARTCTCCALLGAATLVARASACAAARSAGVCSSLSMSCTSPFARMRWKRNFILCTSTLPRVRCHLRNVSVWNMRRTVWQYCTACGILFAYTPIACLHPIAKRSFIPPVG
mmetsp:Transcript_19490/g.50298  ORF Transcript_19490/g.50298 Transcript_19490/m.50298 type:complete len:261 (-) Transcript_19490:779-1561(-)